MLHKFIVVCLALVLAEGQAFGGIVLSLSNLGDLGGGYSYGYGVNNQGHATGVSKINGIDSRAFYWNGSSMLDLGTNPNGGPSFGFDINENNQIVGMANAQPFRWTESDGLQLLDLDNLGSADGINNSDTVVGSIRISDSANNTIVWSADGSPTNPYPGSNSTGSGINDLGQFVGTDELGGYYSPGIFDPKQPLPLTNATDINTSRLITGSVTGDAALFNYDTSTLTLIGRLNPSDPFSMALGISNNNRVVGTSGLSGFIYDSTLGLKEATSLLSSDYAGWQILALEGISDDGTKMIGVGRFNGVDQAVILSVMPPGPAVPEPNFVFDSAKGIQSAYRLTGDAIASLCEQSDECEVDPSFKKMATPTIVKADSSAAENVAKVLENVIEAGRFKGEAKARAEKALEKLRNR